MIRKIALGAAAALLVVGLPVAALGISDSLNSTDVRDTQTATAPVTGDTVPASTQDQAQTRQRLRIHAETGVPEGVTPTQTRQRLHAQDQTGMQGPEQGQGHRGNGRSNGANRQGAQAGDGNQFGKGGPGGNGGYNGSGTPGECTNPDGTSG
jgi:hypothetical protein